MPSYSDPAMTEERDMLAREIAGAEPHAEIEVLARGVAEAYSICAECALPAIASCSMH